MNWYFIFKCTISGVVVGLVSEVARRSPPLAAILVSLPLTSILALIWLYRDTQSTQLVIELSTSIALIVLPSLMFFVGLSTLLKLGGGFWISLALSSVLMVAIYFAYIRLLLVFGLKL